MREKPKLVIFDWDGVIVDSVPIIYQGVVRTFEAAGVPVPTFVEYYCTFTNPWPEWYKSRGITLSEDEIVRHYLSAVDGHKPSFIEGALEIVGRLAEHGVPLAIVSADFRDLIRPRLAEEGVLHFDGRIHDKALKKTEKLRALREEHGAQEHEVFLIGDMASDAIDGVEAGITVVGFAPPERGTREALLSHGAKHCVSGHSELAEFLGLPATPR